MTAEADTQQERATGRVWVVRLDPHGRLAAGAVRLSCSRPACDDQRFSSTAEGRRAAVEHVNLHLSRIREGGGPRGGVWCGCRAADCAWHTADAPDGRHGGAARPAAGAVRCGGPVVLTVYADRAGRLWRIAETCARCAAAIPECRVLDTAPPPARAGGPEAGSPGSGQAAGPAAGPATAGGTAAALFSDHGNSPAATGVPAPTGASAPAGAPTGDSSPAPRPAPVPGARAAAPAGRAPRRPRRWGKIAQRIVPYYLEPEALRLELIDLGDAFRAYQRRPEPDLVLLSGLHDRKARAFAQWADVCGDASLHEDADRAAKAAVTCREMHDNRAGGPLGGLLSTGEQAAPRLLTRTQAEHARTVLGHLGALAPGHEPPVHLAVLMLTLRAARAGIGNVTGQDLGGWLQGDAERVLDALVAAGWMRMPCTAAEALDARPEDPTAVTVPTLLPDGQRPFTLGKVTRARISGWAQKVVNDRKLRKKKSPPAARLLAVYTAAHTRVDGGLGHAEDDGLDLAEAAAFCAVPPEEVAEHVERLLTADWLSEGSAEEGRLRGRLSDRVLHLSALL
ncbi:hypothetical protein [Streptomyces sp. NRRL F-5126]|uniref:hypothetical protein n=1 Tax=Streptomyces sp. NRRL F-5126 TaxID=1463857 RepID=UPI0004C82E9F|nr:hypothetical protein [Streptomyces sp. NRRL F-5126]